MLVNIDDIRSQQIMDSETNRVASNLQYWAVSTNWTSQLPCRLLQEIERSRKVQICQRMFTSEGEAINSPE
jgi:hypothetical protein